MGYCIVILGIFRDIFGFSEIQITSSGGRVLQHLICIKIGTVRPTHRLLQGRLNRSCQDERTVKRHHVCHGA
jgi:hypothetical protein